MRGYLPAAPDGSRLRPRTRAPDSIDDAYTGGSFRRLRRRRGSLLVRSFARCEAAVDPGILVRLGG